MSDPSTLGSLVRKRRLESGYSLGQLASKVGKTAAEVRAWERDTEMPEHGIIERLASTLEIDLDEIKKRLQEGKKALEAEREAARKAAAAEAAAEEEDADAEAAEDDEQGEPAAETSGEDAEESEEDLPGFAVDDPFTPPPPIADVVPPDTSPVAEPDRDDTPVPEMDLLDAPTEPVPVPIITETATAARAGRAAAVLEEPPPPAMPVSDPLPDSDPGLLRYLEPLRILFDPHNRYLYWIRAGLTVVVMMIFAVILLQQLGNLLDAFGELLDTIEPTAPDPDDLDV
ncbi:MAG: helix-turn-helix transcriptional regulator [Acidimicrobiia bacterium]|nr:helix-turn-helix transcriptional regulator [Acidimicrobiia bacterium]